MAGCRLAGCGSPVATKGRQASRVKIVLLMPNCNGRRCQLRLRFNRLRLKLGVLALQEF